MASRRRDDSFRTPEWEAWERRLTGLFTITSQWEPLVEDPPAPAPGSPLAGDDRAWSLLPASTVAWLGLVSAIEHLAAARRLMQETRTMMPSPYMSLIRPALMGAAQTLWVLLPPLRAERVRRQLIVAHEEFQESRHLAREALEPPLRDKLPLKAVQAAKGQLARATERQTNTAAELQRRGHTLSKVNMTDVIKEAAAYVAAADPWSHQAIRSSWRIASGDAHGKLWPMLHRAARTPGAEPGATLLQDGANIEMVGMVAGSAYQLTKAALDMFQQRCASPHGDQS
ncbi:hypothetical protein SAMN06273567_107164 [Geodermatophilus aquaeductus]|uniref:Uncharacterized protein n=1 Tax=Geodermatophilus aquaeductus TaxID=1564161 RepID=A0A521F9D7_9ACTN|nr:hypothetical protein [Geodermatophilus aquaeductus]SMO92231.1 hypothetical protein SAMN06273567_107164 [Geodermatophilus aquaeductus]